MDFNKKVILITGSSSGLGKQMALGFAKSGGNVSINYNNSKDEAEKLSDEITKKYNESLCVQCDVGDIDSVKKMFTRIINKFGKIDVLVNAAAIYEDGQHKVNENSIINPKSVYGKTKVKGEMLVQLKCKRNKINYGILRYFNIAGSSPSGKIGLINKSDHLFKNYSREIIKKTPILKIYGNDYNTSDGSCIRDFIHVTDIAEIHYKVLEKIDKSQKSKILNCGYSKGTSVLEVAKEFKKQSKNKVKILITKKRRGDLVKIIASNNRLLKFIKWKPKFDNLKKIVKSCIKWEKKI